MSDLALREIAATLNGIESYPKMYGSCPEAIEAQYLILLSLQGRLTGLSHEEVRNIIRQVTVARVGGGPDSFLFARCKTEEELLDGLKEIRKRVTGAAWNPGQ